MRTLSSACVLALALACIPWSAAQSYTYSTVAGLPYNYGAADGPASSAQFNNPQGVVGDNAGNLFVADSFNHIIRKITPTGQVTTFAGLAGASESADGRGSAARFFLPEGLAMDSAGDLYVADSGNDTIRRITPEGVVTTVAGLANGHGSADGTIASARFASPSGIAVNGAGEIYVVEGFNCTVRRIARDGTVSTIAGRAGQIGSADGFGSDARFNTPNGIAIDGSGNLYVADSQNHTIRKITPTGLVSTIAGMPGQIGFADGSGDSARFWQPWGIATDRADNVYVTDSLNAAIRRITPEGIVSTIAGAVGSARGSDDGPIASARFSTPTGIHVDAMGNIYVADVGISRIRKISAGMVSTFAGAGPAGESRDGVGANAHFDGPGGMTIDAMGVLYVADIFGSTIRRILPSGEVTTIAGRQYTSGSADGVGSTARFSRPYGVALDSRGFVFVVDSRNQTIRKITPDGVVTTFAGLPLVSGTSDGLAGVALFNNPSGIAVDRVDNLYVTDTGNHAVRKITPSGVVTTFAGVGGVAGSVDGSGGTARFNSPDGIAVDGDGNIYVVDTKNYTVRKVTADGVVTTLAGLAGRRGSVDATGTAARFWQPNGVTVDRAGNVYVTDGIDDTVRKITPAGTVTTIGGVSGHWGYIDGVGAAARFFSGSTLGAGIVVDNSGNLYIADTNNDLIRRGEPSRVIASQPASRTTNAGDAVAFSVAATIGGEAISSHQWQLNGVSLPAGGSAATLTLTDVQPQNTGVYTVLLANSAGTATADPAILGVLTASKVIGAGTELQPTNIAHLNGGVFDQVLLGGAAETITADAGQVTRTSYIDLNNDIVQVEFSGAGSLSLVLTDSSGPATPVNYNQSTVSYMKGHAGIVIAGADETTNVSVFSVGRATAFDPTGAYNILLGPSATNVPANNGSSLFVGHATTAYDGIADIAFVAIASTNGQFGGVRTSNAHYFATKGLTGVYAPGVQFTGPVFVGNISAYDAAIPVLHIGSSSDMRITGGDLLQTNGQPVKVSGLTQLKFTEGSDSQGKTLPAKTNRAVLQQNGVDVTAQVVVNPTP